MIYDSIEELCDFFKQIINQKNLVITNESNGIKTSWNFIKGVSEDKIELIFMCRVNPRKIIQSNDYPDIWIFNPSSCLNNHI